MNLDELIAVCEAATPGPWEQTDGYCTANGRVVAQCGKYANAAFIAAAREHFPACLRRIKELERENAELRAIVESVDECRRVRVLKVLCVDPGSARACAAAQKKLNQLLAAARVAAV